MNTNRELSTSALESLLKVLDGIGTALPRRRVSFSGSSSESTRTSPGFLQGVLRSAV